MADLPTLTAEQVASAIPGATEVSRAGSGGQKVVFKATIEGATYALKFASAADLVDDMATLDYPMDDVVARAQREVETMRDCQSAYMVKLGPIGLSFAEIEGQSVLYFSEEFVAGSDLRTVFLNEGRFSAEDVRRLGLHIGQAIGALWGIGKIHRDIKPGNIMRRENGDFVLLDAGFAFDIEGASLSVGPVGTPAYFSPEQWDFSTRRTVLDFRSDIFSLGVTMYQMATGVHPFFEPGDSRHTLADKIVSHNPELPSTLVPGFPGALEDTIIRMLGKSPHLRFRRCSQLLESLTKE